MHEPFLIAVVKTAGSTLALFGAIVAWLANNLISWCAWQIGRSVRRFEAMKALRAEIGAFQDEELYYADPAKLEALLQRLKADLGPYKPWTPYVPGVDRTPVFDNLVVAGSWPGLSSTVLERVVCYYYVAGGLNVQLKDFTSEAYKQLSRARQADVIRDLKPLAEDTAKARKDVLTTIDVAPPTCQTCLLVVFVVSVIAAYVCAPPLVAASNRFAQAFISAAEWASTCDVLLKDKQK
jgi:hypothetical protein